ncbi:hypothetical protein AJ80_03685 [Polytolypa hystricis UAMH7299]|uniref:Cytochrome P450 monooxygenase n=1 Tax=Polytolypa hystricis (strain UAMH7299) TaxID=1447883 RepID=A0A2B7YHM1_POLH7|nr:hypothetical protein AJ80_03685 [Polytolypa hystricis UAMH7299]
MAGIKFIYISGNTVGAALVLELCAAGLFLYFFFLAVYRLWLSPLAKFPGPALNAISSLPIVVWALKGRLPMETRKLHEKYGPIVRVSPNELAFTSATAWQDIYGHRPGREDLLKSRRHAASRDILPGVDSIGTGDNATHTHHRRAIAPAFTRKALWEQEPIVQGFVDKLMDNFHAYAKKGETVDIGKWFNFLTFDVIGDLAFGESFNCLETKQFHFWVALVSHAMRMASMEQATRRLAKNGSALQALLFHLVPKRFKQKRRDFAGYNKEKVLRRINNTTTERKDFLHYILRKDNKYQLTHDEIIANSSAFIVAGSETTAMALSALTNHLLHYPHVYQKLKDEIRGTFTSEDEINLKAVNALPYLNACLEENLRIFPPAPVAFSRVVQPEGDILDEMHIPGGTNVSVSTWCAHHSPLNFKDHDQFIPERWLEGNEEFKDDQKLAFRPFSLGPRNCIGKDVSYLEMRLAASRMIWNFDFEAADDLWEWDPEGDRRHMRAYLMWEKPELNVKLAKVER